MPRAVGHRRGRRRGSIEELPSGALRVRVYAGVDPVTGRRHDLTETIPAGPKAGVQAEQALTRLLNELDERRNPRTNATVNQLLDRYFAMVDAEQTTTRTYAGYSRKHIRPLLGELKVGAVDGDVLDSFYAELRRCREHCSGRRYVEHRTNRSHDCDDRCRKHRCTPLAASTIRQIHFILSGAYKRAIRWRWVATSPVSQAEPPAAPTPNPRPPSAEEAARIVTEAWREPDWGTLVWLAMTTGARRGELCGLRWQHVDLENAVVTLQRSIAQAGAEVWEKDTKTHQQRRITLDADTVEVLSEHWERCAARAAALGLVLGKRAFVFSAAPDGSTNLRPDSVSERYRALADRLGIDTTLHRLRHYNATELIAAGVDVRTVAGRLGHGGGGTTTLRVYSAWVSESDQRAAGSLLRRLPGRRVTPQPVEVPALSAPTAPFEELAHELLAAIANGTLPVGGYLPSGEQLAQAHGVSRATVQRAVTLLAAHGLVEVSKGRRAVVTLPPGSVAAPAPILQVRNENGGASVERRLLDLEIRRRGRVVATVTAEANPKNAADLRQLLVEAIRRDGRDESEIADYEMAIHHAGEPNLLTTFVASMRRT
jgi:integrase